MILGVTTAEQVNPLLDASDSVDCVCDSEKVRVVSAYLHEKFPDRPVREFHSHSTVVVPGYFPAPCANYHVLSISDELPYCGVLTSGFLELPVRELRDQLRRWNLAKAMQADRIVIVEEDGLSPL